MEGQQRPNPVLPLVNRLALDYEVDQDIVRSMLAGASMLNMIVCLAIEQGRPDRLPTAMKAYAMTFSQLAKHLNISSAKMESLMCDALDGVIFTLQDSEFIKAAREARDASRKF